MPVLDYAGEGGGDAVVDCERARPRDGIGDDAAGVAAEVEGGETIVVEVERGGCDAAATVSPPCMAPIRRPPANCRR